ncbi:hypothetical protein STSR3_56 [Salmonella virus STSR3]|nr:hypothetical protein STSR3_56 [Salmonella virus STSR3]
MASNSDYPVIVSDCGFEQEVIALIEGGHEVKLVRMNRRGFEFDETDSRNYVYLPVCYYGENGYEEVDVDLFDGDPVYTAYELIRKFKLKEHELIKLAKAHLIECALSSNQSGRQND